MPRGQIRDHAMLRDNLLAYVKTAGAGGVPLKHALKQIVSEGREPTGSDYTIALNLRKEKQLIASGNKGGPLHVYHKDFRDGVSAPKPEAPPEPQKHIRRRRRHANHKAADILIVISYGQKESITLSYEDARQVYRRLAALFATESR